MRNFKVYNENNKTTTSNIIFILFRQQVVIFFKQLKCSTYSLLNNEMDIRSNTATFNKTYPNVRAQQDQSLYSINLILVSNRVI